MQLTLIRHGLTAGNVQRLFYGSTDLPLLPEGLAALEQLRQSGSYPQAGRFYTSGMRRANQTLAALYGPVAYAVLPGLQEIDFGEFEMKSYPELCNLPGFQAWITGDNEANVCPGGESGVQVTRRALAALAPLLAAEEDAVCITHGGVIGGVLAQWFPQGNRYDWTPQPGHGFQITCLAGKPVDIRPIP